MAKYRGIFECNKPLVLIGKKANVIKGQNGQPDGVWYLLEFSDGQDKITITCGEKWNITLDDGSEKTFDVAELIFLKSYYITISPEIDNKGFQKMKLRTWKLVK